MNKTALLTLALWPHFLFCNALEQSRYTAVLPLLSQFKRPITVALFDPSYEFSHALHEKHHATCIMISPDTDNSLLRKCLAYNPSLTLIKKRPSVHELEQLAECEQCDIVGAFSVLEDYGSCAKRAVHQITKFGDYCFFESNNAEQATLMLTHDAQAIATYENRMLWLVHKPKKYLTRRSWFYVAENKKMYQVQSTFTNKQFIKNKNGKEIIPWIEGINLQTFKQLNGVYPTHAMIREELKKLRSISHNDMAIFNLLIQGKNIIPIDGNEEGRTRWLRFALRAVMSEFR